MFLQRLMWKRQEPERCDCALAIPQKYESPRTSPGILQAQTNVVRIKLRVTKYEHTIPVWVVCRSPSGMKASVRRSNPNFAPTLRNASTILMSGMRREEGLRRLMVVTADSLSATVQYVKRYIYVPSIGLSEFFSVQVSKVPPSSQAFLRSFNFSPIHIALIKSQDLLQLS